MAYDDILDEEVGTQSGRGLRAIPLPDILERNEPASEEAPTPKLRAVPIGIPYKPEGSEYSPPPVYEGRQTSQYEAPDIIEKPLPPQQSRHATPPVAPAKVTPPAPKIQPRESTPSVTPKPVTQEQARAEAAPKFKDPRNVDRYMSLINEANASTDINKRQELFNTARFLSENEDASGAPDSPTESIRNAIKQKGWIGPASREQTERDQLAREEAIVQKELERIRPKIGFDRGSELVSDEFKKQRAPRVWAKEQAAIKSRELAEKARADKEHEKFIEDVYTRKAERANVDDYRKLKKINPAMPHADALELMKNDDAYMPKNSMRQIAAEQQEMLRQHKLADPAEVARLLNVAPVGEYYKNKLPSMSLPQRSFAADAETLYTAVAANNGMVTPEHLQMVFQMGQDEADRFLVQGEAGIVDTVKEYLSDSQRFADFVPFVSGGVTAYRFIDAALALDKIESGQGSLDDLLVVRNHLALEALKGRKRDRGGFVVDTVAQAFPFIAEMYFSGGSAAGAKEGLKLGVKARLKHIIGQGLKKGLTFPTRAAAMPRFVGMIAREAAPVEVGGGGHDLISSVGRAWGDLVIEATSEGLGTTMIDPALSGAKKIFLDSIRKTILNPAAKAGNKFGAKALGHAGLKSFKNFLARTGRPVEQIQKFLLETGVNSPVSEWMEEEYGKMMRAAAGLEEYSLTTPDEFLNQMVAFSVMPAAARVPGMIASPLEFLDPKGRADARRYNATKERRKDLLEVGMSEKQYLETSEGKDLTGMSPRMAEKVALSEAEAALAASRAPAPAQAQTEEAVTWTDEQQPDGSVRQVSEVDSQAFDDQGNSIGEAETVKVYRNPDGSREYTTANGDVYESPAGSQDFKLRATPASPSAQTPVSPTQAPAAAPALASTAQTQSQPAEAPQAPSPAAVQPLSGAAAVSQPVPQEQVTPTPKETPSAVQEQKAETPDAGRGTQPAVRQEGQDTAGGGTRVRAEVPAQEVEKKPNEQDRTEPARPAVSQPVAGKGTAEDGGVTAQPTAKPQPAAAEGTTGPSSKPAPKAIQRGDKVSYTLRGQKLTGTVTNENEIGSVRITEDVSKRSRLMSPDKVTPIQKGTEDVRQRTDERDAGQRVDAERKTDSQEGQKEAQKEGQERPVQGEGGADVRASTGVIRVHSPKSLAKPAPKRPMFNKKNVVSIISRMWKRLTNEAEAHTTVVENEEELLRILPPHVGRQWIATQRPSAFVAENKKVYIVADLIVNLDDLRQRYGHEIIGHLGADRALSQKDKNWIAARVREAAKGGNEDAQRVLFMAYGESYRADEHTDEIVAYLFGKMSTLTNEQINQTLFKRILSYIRAWLRDIGLGTVNTDDEILRLFRNSIKVDKNKDVKLSETAKDVSASRGVIGDPFNPQNISKVLGTNAEVSAAINAIAETMGFDKAKMILTKGGMPADNALFQIEKILSGEEAIPSHKTMKDIVAWVGQYANQNQVIPEGVDFNTEEGRKAAVDALVKHSLLELDAWEKLNRPYVSFYTTDIIEKTNPWLSKWAKRDKDIAAKMVEEGRDKLTDDEVKLLHVLGAFSSANAAPDMDTMYGLWVLKEYMLYGTLTGMTSNPKHIWKTDKSAPKDSDGKHPRKPTYITPRGKITFAPSRITPSGKRVPNQPNLVTGKFKKISRTFNLASVRNLGRVIDHFGGGKEGLAKTMKWLETEHTWAEIVDVIGAEAAKKLNTHEYLQRDLKKPNDPSKKVMGVFVLGNNPKQGSYILNRWQKLKTITKDMWVARTMSRYFREPNTGVPWKHTNPLGRIKRNILEEAWGKVGEKLGIEPAIVQEKMWDMEKVFYGILGSNEGAAYPSEGVLRAMTIAVKASVEITDAGMALIRAFNKTNVADGIHELGHVARLFLFDKSIPKENREGITDADIDAAMEWSGVVDGKWTTDAEEKFADGLLKYITDGKFPSKGVESLFKKVVNWLKKLFKTLRKKGVEDRVGAIEISPRMREVFDKLITRGRQEAQMSWEAAPSTKMDILTELHSAPYDIKKKYLDRIQNILFKDGKDLIAEIAGLDLTVIHKGFSAWEGAVGAGAQSFFDVGLQNEKGVKSVNDEYRKKLDLYANLYGYILSQDAVYWQVPIYTKDLNQANGFEITGKRGWTKGEFEALYDALNQEFGVEAGMAPGYLKNGARILNFAIDNADFQSRIRKVVNTLGEDFLGGGLVVQSYRADTGNPDDVSNKWKENPNGEVYRSRISKAGRPNLQRRADVLRDAVLRESRKFAKEQKWNPKFSAAPIKASRGAIGSRQGEQGTGASPEGSFRVSNDVGRRFRRNLSAAAASQRFEKSVEVKSEEFYLDPSNKLFANKDLTAGAAVTPSGDLVSVFKTKGVPSEDIEGVLSEAALESVTLDGYDINGMLPNTYSAFQFRPAARIKFNRDFAPDGWPYDIAGEPDIVMMVRDVDGSSGLPEIVNRNYAEIRDTIPLFTDYDEAVAHRAKAIAKMNKGGIKASRGAITPKQDTDYLAAVKRGDMETAQKMVDEAAKKAGYTIGPVYHGTPNYDYNQDYLKAVKEMHGFIFPNEPELDINFKSGTPESSRFWEYVGFFDRDFHRIKPELKEKIPANVIRRWEVGQKKRFTVFDDSKKGSSTGAYDAKRGFFFSPNEKFSARFMSTYSIDSFTGSVKKETGPGFMYRVYLKPGRLLDLRNHSAAESKAKQTFSDVSEYDTVWNKVKWTPGFTKGPSRVTEEIMVRNPANIKLADPVTYDDQGEVIPLSERFNEKSSDIRASRGAVGDQTKTENFKRWFGDSKVVNPDGSPMVMYHGTDKDFDVFENRGGKVTVLFSVFDVDRKGFFFTSDKELASEFGRKIVDVYLSIQNPANFNDSKMWQKIKGDLVGKGWNERYLDRSEMWEMFDVDDVNDGAKLIKDLKSLGYDGAIIEEPGIGGKSGQAYIAFDQTQIKSATKNSGAFDSTNPSIKASMGGIGGMPKLQFDNPGGGWLEREVSRVKEKGRNEFGAPSFRSVTGYFENNDPVTIPVETLAKIPGMRGEQSNVRSDDLDAITKVMKDTGKLPLDKNGDPYHPFIMVAYNGEAWVNEGNHRIMAAKKLGWDTMPVVVRYFDGGEDVDGPLHPDKIAEFYRQKSSIKASRATVAGKPVTRGKQDLSLPGSTSGRNIDWNHFRQAYGLPIMDTSEHQSQSEMFARVKAEMETAEGYEQFKRDIADIARTNRPATATELMKVIYRLAVLRSEYVEIAKKYHDDLKKNQGSFFQQSMEDDITQREMEIELLTSMAKRSKAEIARSLATAQFTLNDAFSPETYLHRAIIATKGKMTKRQRAKLDKEIKKLTELNDDLRKRLQLEKEKYAEAQLKVKDELNQVREEELFKANEKIAELQKQIDETVDKKVKERVAEAMAKEKVKVKRDKFVSKAKNLADDIRELMKGCLPKGTS